MGRVSIEVCLISARGLRRSPSLWKRHWFAVGWIDPKDKYCTKIDDSGNPNPVWHTKFSFQVDSSESSFQGLSLNVQVYSRDPIFLTEKLQGAATIALAEFLRKHNSGSENAPRPGNGDVGSYQLRKKKSGKPRGFVDISVRVSSEYGEEPFSYPEHGGEIMLLDHDNRITMPTEKALAPAYSTGPTALPLAAHKQPNRAQAEQPYTHPTPFPANCANPCVGGPTYPSAAGPSYRPFQGRPPLPQQLQLTTGHMQNYLTRANYGTTGSYMNLPSSSAAAGQGRGLGLGIGAGAGALAAGGMMFGDELVSGFDIPAGIMQDSSFTVSLDPLFL